MVGPARASVEFRICDVPMTVNETIVGIVPGCLRPYLHVKCQNLKFIQYSRALLNENKWRAWFPD